MKTINVNKLYIGKNREREFRLGMFVKNEPILREILINGDTISLSEKGLIIDPSLQLSAILFGDYDKEDQRKPSRIFSNLEVSERLVYEWALTIKDDEEFQQGLAYLCDSRTSSGYREGVEKFMKKELLHSLLFDYACAIQSAKELGNEPRLEK